MKDQKKVAAAALWLAATLMTGCSEMPRTVTEPRGTASGAGGSVPNETDDGTEALLDASSEASSPLEAAPRLAPASASGGRGAVTRWASGRKSGEGGGSGPRFATHGARERPRPEPAVPNRPPIDIEKMRGTGTLPDGEADAEPAEPVPPADEAEPADESEPADVELPDAEATTDPPAEVLEEGTEPGEAEAGEADQVQETEEADPVQEPEEADPVEQPEEADPVEQPDEAGPVEEADDADDAEQAEDAGEKKADEDLDSLLKDLEES